MSKRTRDDAIKQEPTSGGANSIARGSAVKQESLPDAQNEANIKARGSVIKREPLDAQGLANSVWQSPAVKRESPDTRGSPVLKQEPQANAKVELGTAATSFAKNEARTPHEERPKQEKIQAAESNLHTVVSTSATTSATKSEDHVPPPPKRAKTMSPPPPPPPPAASPARISTRCFMSFDIRSNHRYKCNSGGRIRYSRGTGRLTCCDAMVDNDSYRFALEPWNQYDRNAVQIIGEQTDDIVGHVPREWNVEVGDVLQQVQDLGNESVKVYGESSCGHPLQIRCLIEGPADVLDGIVAEGYESE